MTFGTALLGGGFLGSVFIVGPVGMVQLNAALGWPDMHWVIARNAGGGLLALGGLLVLWCWVLFAREGRGTPVPVNPPRRLVRSGPYRLSRNPTYFAYFVMLVGLFLFRGELALLLYAGLYALMIHLWIVRYEEPGLCRRFGQTYLAYMGRVPRWFAISRPRRDR
jgi:protein-S-isoprenylcysteine O-methyltransferase Ste14